MSKRREQPDRATPPAGPQAPVTHADPDRSDTVVLERGDVDLESTASYRRTTPPDGR